MPGKQQQLKKKKKISAFKETLPVCGERGKKKTLACGCVKPQQLREESGINKADLKGLEGPREKQRTTRTLSHPRGQRSLAGARVHARTRAQMSSMP